MPMVFLKQAVDEANSPKLSLVDLVKSHVGGFEKAREFYPVHASDLTNASFCPRRISLYELTGTKPKPTYLSTSLRTTYDMGNAVADLFREKWAGQESVGDWRCDICGEFRTFCRKPPDHISKDHKCNWKYKEIVFKSKTHDFIGSLDLIADLKAPKLFLVELKIMAPEMFAALEAPLSEHRLRTALYLYLVEDSLNPYHTSINTQVGKVLYVSRGFGKKNLDSDGEILPFKEYDVPRDDASIQVFLDYADEVKLFKDKGVIPKGVCATPMDKIAKSCSQCKACFSGLYPAGSIKKGYNE